MGSYTVNTEASNGDIRVDMEARKDNKNAATISVHKLRYTVDVKAKKGACGGTVEKHILNDITGIFKPGMNAILGPTGSGKTSLLDVIAGRKDPHGLSGTLLVDGHRQPDNFKCMTGYVVQDDVVMGTLTVRENFMFSANLRLPEHVSHEEKKRLVDEIIVELGLTHVADSKVGTEFIRGISGGERKRTNIGMELITSPPVLFLDEPTTGLDASTANAVMILLKRLARRGRTIIFSIHQPRYAIFKLFDNMMLLAQGRTVYHGPANQALDYFSSIGYECEEHNNPPDFFLDVINGDSSSVQAALAIERAMNSATPGPSDSTSVRDSAVEDTAPEKKEFIDQEGKEFSSKVTITTQEKEGHFAEILAENYRNSDSYSEIKKLVDPIEDAFFNEGGIDVAVKSGQYAASFCTQLNYVCRRSILNILRNPQTSFVQMFIVIVFAVIVGIIYLRLDIYMPAAIQNRIGALFFIIMNQVFSNLSAVELFIKERAIFIHENASGFYRVSSFFVAKVLCDIVPLRAIPLSLFCVVAYFMVGLQPDVTKFFIFYLNLFLTTFAACGIAFLLSAAFRIFAIANLMIALCFVISMVFSGLLVNLQTMGSWLSWIQYLSIFRYALNALAINELKDMVFCTQIPTDNTTFTVCDNTTGNAYLESQGIEYKTPWDLWVNTMALALIGLAFMVFAWLRLIFIKKLK